MDHLKEISRRDFLRGIPKYLADSVRSFTNEYFKPADAGAETGDVSVINDNSPRIARLNRDDCLAWEGSGCQFCYLACPLRDRAVTIEDQRPRIHASLCDGCAKCVAACQTVNDSPAIKMVLYRASINL